MKHNFLVSLNSSGESFEKAISLYYSTFRFNSDFYKNHDVVIFYGHNLPKHYKDKIVHGTVGFYAKYLKGNRLTPCCDIELLLCYRDTILNKLIRQNVLSCRAAEKLSCNRTIYERYINNLPLEYIYPNYISKVKELSIGMLGLSSVRQLYFERNIIYLDKMIEGNYGIVRLYTLDYSGIVGHLNLSRTQKIPSYDILHSLQHKSVISCNSAMFLLNIRHMLKSATNVIVGYRPHDSHPRPNRNSALKFILNTIPSIVEPSNKIANEMFRKYHQSEDIENLVYSELYSSLLYDLSKQYGMLMFEDSLLL